MRQFLTPTTHTAQNSIVCAPDPNKNLVMEQKQLRNTLCSKRCPSMMCRSAPDLPPCTQNHSFHYGQWTSRSQGHLCCVAPEGSFSDSSQSSLLAHRFSASAVNLSAKLCFQQGAHHFHTHLYVDSGHSGTSVSVWANLKKKKKKGPCRARKCRQPESLNAEPTSAFPNTVSVQLYRTALHKFAVLQKTFLCA